MDPDVQANSDEIEWPVLREYDSGHLDRISLPLGGIGTGTIGFGGRGDLRDFEVGNRPAKGFAPESAFFLLRTRRSGQRPDVRLLEGPIDDRHFEGADGATVANHGLPRFARATFATAYPLGQVRLEHPDLPEVTIRGFNPLVPGDLDASSWPAVILRYRVANHDATPLEATVVGSIQNFVGSNGTEVATGGNRNERVADGRIVGIRMTAPELDPHRESAGQFVIAAMGEGGDEISTRTAWRDFEFFGREGLLDLWDDLADDGRITELLQDGERPVGSVAVSATLAPGETREFAFLLSWVFPNRRAWDGRDADGRDAVGAIIGNHYAVLHPDAWETVRELARDLPELESRTVRAVSAIVDSSVPVAIREAALFNISTLRSETVFRSADGRFWGWEGTGDRGGSCPGNCNHVWGYEFASGFWFSDLSWSFRETQYELATDDDGFMPFRINLPIGARPHGDIWQMWNSTAAADGQMASIVHLLFDWRMTGDEDRLRRLWPAARRSLEFAWIPGGWDADRDGVMEGEQHNTMDVSFYGPNSIMGSWYLAALQAGAELADHLGQPEFAATCRRLLASGSRFLDDELFTGEEYRIQLTPVATAPPSDPRLSLRPRPLDGPDDHNQIGNGTFIDQVIGQYAARVVGLAPVLDVGHVRTTLDTIFRKNFRESLADQFNVMRSFALADESGVLMCSYPDGARPRRPFPYHSEVMTGFEHALATAHIYDGDRATAVRIIESTRRRYDGRRRNPFDEAECGHHYARALASWSAFVAWNGFGYRASAGRFTMDFHDPEGSTFWSTGSAYGTWRQWRESGRLVAEIGVIEGTIRIDEVVSHGKVAQPPRGSHGAGTRIPVDLGPVA